MVFSAEDYPELTCFDEVMPKNCGGPIYDMAPLYEATSSQKHWVWHALSVDHTVLPSTDTFIHVIHKNLAVYTLLYLWLILTDFSVLFLIIFVVKKFCSRICHIALIMCVPYIIK